MTEVVELEVLGRLSEVVFRFCRSCQKSQECTKGGARSLWRRFARICFPRAGEAVESSVDASGRLVTFRDGSPAIFGVRVL